MSPSSLKLTLLTALTTFLTGIRILSMEAYNALNFQRLLMERMSIDGQ